MSELTTDFTVKPTKRPVTCPCCLRSYNPAKSIWEANKTKTSETQNIVCPACCLDEKITKPEADK